MLYSVTPCIKKRSGRREPLNVLADYGKHDGGQLSKLRGKGMFDGVVNSLETHFLLCKQRAPSHEDGRSVTAWGACERRLLREQTRDVLRSKEA
jgi:hypothetical protein